MKKELNSYRGMLQRCYYPKHNRFEHYGGRGIKVCDRWLQSFQNFIDDMGLKPSDKHSLDRIDNDKDYSHENCRWATPSEQMSNRRPFKLKNKRKHTKENIGQKLAVSKKVINTRTGVIYPSVTEAAKAVNIKRAYLNKMLTGTRNNKSDLIFVTNECS
jgi:hypothetical protein